MVSTYLLSSNNSWRCNAQREYGVFTYLCLGTNDLARAAKFYDATMTTLGLTRIASPDEAEWQGWLGWGTYDDHGAKEIALWIGQPFNNEAAAPGNGVMVALKTSSWKQVEAFHAAALANGGTSEGEPGLRPQYNPDFYAAYVRDPDGNKLAVVCRGLTQPQ
jgi:catechol 2,3-dioxygenase-like lactoylglutathione lyase family enzyme